MNRPSKPGKRPAQSEQRPPVNGQPYQTQNTSLAVTLGTCGAPYWRSNGAASGVYSVYTAEILRAIPGDGGKPHYQGWELEDAAADAWKNGIPGLIVYRFIYCDLVARIVKAYADYEKLLHAIEESGACDKPNAAGGVEMAEVDIEPEDAARFACQLLKNRRKFLNEWKNHVPFVVSQGKAKTTREGEKTITVGSMKAYPLTASPTVRKKLKL